MVDLTADTPPSSPGPPNPSSAMKHSTEASSSHVHTAFGSIATNPSSSQSAVSDSNDANNHPGLVPPTTAAVMISAAIKKLASTSKSSGSRTLNHIKTVTATRRAGSTQKASEIRPESVIANVAPMSESVAVSTIATEPQFSPLVLDVLGHREMMQALADSAERESHLIRDMLTGEPPSSAGTMFKVLIWEIYQHYFSLVGATC